MNMEKTLGEKNLANIANKLEIPLVVSDILHDKERLTGDAQYAIHEAISDMQPDSALLCVALSVKKITSANALTSPGLRVVEMECARVIDEYAELWLKNAENGIVDEAEAFDVISRTAEDLESMADMLDTHACLVRNRDARALCEIMAIQARAHALVAETYLEAIEQPLEIPAPAVARKALSGNIIRFPEKA